MSKQNLERIKGGSGRTVASMKSSVEKTAMKRSSQRRRKFPVAPIQISFVELGGPTPEGGKPNDRFFALPPEQTVLVGQTVTWHNKTGGTARLWFPEAAEVSDDCINMPQDIDPVAGFSLRIKQGAKKGPHSYQVYCVVRDIKGFAQGDSDPRINVE